MLEFSLLGTLVVLCDGVTVTIPRGKPQIILVVLLMRRGKPVGTERLIELLWPGCPPTKAKQATVHVHISRLRTAFTSRGFEDPVTTDGGYSIDPGSCQFDVAQFETLIVSGRAAAARENLEDAFEDQGRALSHWRDEEPMIGIEYPAQLDDEVRELIALRFSVREEWCETGLRLKRYREVLPVLRRLYKADPLREKVYELLLAAEYQDGGQAQGLGVYRRIRDALVEEGCQPSPRLRWMHKQVLDGKPAISLLTPATAAA